MHRTFAMLTVYNGLIIDYFHYLLTWQQQLCIGKVHFFIGGGGGGGLGRQRGGSFPLGPAKEKHDPSQKIT